MSKHLVTVEFRSYTLKPGRTGEFDRLMRSQVVPMLQRWGFDVVAQGLSADGDDRAYLVRAYRDLTHREASEDIFDGSTEWLDGPREAVLDCIEDYASVVLVLPAGTVDALRWGAQAAQATTQGSSPAE
ncbi:MAG: NIPSNAP family protein [Arenimonas sp.]